MNKDLEVSGRRVGVAVDFSACGDLALKRAVDNVVRDGDSLIVVVCLPEKFYEGGEMQLWETTGSRSALDSDLIWGRLGLAYRSFSIVIHGVRTLIPASQFTDPAITKKYGMKPKDATMDIVKIAANQKKVRIMMKIYWGDAREICEAVDKIPFDFLVVGNRGLGSIQRTLMGSGSNYVVNHASCPVVVVKSSDRR